MKLQIDFVYFSKEKIFPASVYYKNFIAKNTFYIFFFLNFKKVFPSTKVFSQIPMSLTFQQKFQRFGLWLTATTIPTDFYPSFETGSKSLGARTCEWHVLTTIVRSISRNREHHPLVLFGFQTATTANTFPNLCFGGEKTPRNVHTLDNAIYPKNKVRVKSWNFFSFPKGVDGK